MRLHQVCAVALAVCFAASAAGAQDAQAFVFGTYYECEISSEDRADAIYKETVAPLVRKQIEAGRFTASGYARHWLGGKWRRLEYQVGTDLSAMVEARQAIITELLDAHKETTAELDSICPTHDDYIWSSVVSSMPPEDLARERARVVMSTYFVCDGREREADAIVKSAFAPVLNGHIKEGKIERWNWMEHFAGGKYRRILVLDGKDHASILEYWNMLDGALSDAQSDLTQRFFDICPTHTDYVWEIGTE